MACFKHQKEKYNQLFSLTFLCIFFSLSWIIENVSAYFQFLTIPGHLPLLWESTSNEVHYAVNNSAEHHQTLHYC